MAALKAMGDCGVTRKSSGAAHQNQIASVITGHYCQVEEVVAAKEPKGTEHHDRVLPSGNLI